MAWSEFCAMLFAGKNSIRGGLRLTRGAMLRAVLSPRVRSVMLVGAPDTGKTTLASELLDLLSMKERTAVLDLDMGQSRVGPPSALGLGIVEGGFKGWERVKAEAIYFTGSLSPAGARTLLDTALRLCRKTVIDTTGLVSGGLGRSLKQYKAELLRPDLVVALERDGELGHILDAYRRQAGPRVLRLRPDEAVSIKGATHRNGYRASAFAGYMEGARAFTVDLRTKAVRFTGEEDGALVGRLVSFRDRMQRDLAIGIIQAAEGEWLEVAAPLPKRARYTTVMIGRAKAPGR